MEPIATIHNSYSEKFGIPRQSGRSDNTSTIVFEKKYRNPDALRGIEGFSHLWLIFGFSKARTTNGKWNATVRPPRLGGNLRVGVFASRSPYRPNGIGLSSVKLISVVKSEKRGSVLIVKGADLLDGTPIYDIKPYLPFTDCHPDATSGYAGEFASYALEVSGTEKLSGILSDEEKQTVIDILSNDPRPSYQNDEERVYRLTHSGYEIGFTVRDGKACIVSAEPAEK